MIRRYLVLTFICVALLQTPAFAQDKTTANPTDKTVVDATWANLTRALVRFNVLDFSDPELVDEYAMITDCDLYKAYYQDDFKWHQIREAIKKSVALNASTYPIGFHYDTKLQLDRYDFMTKIFRFTKKSVIANANMFTLHAVEGTGCGEGEVSNIPRFFHAVIGMPIYMEGLPLSEKEANTLLDMMKIDQNDSRIIYASFNMHITHIDPFVRMTGRFADRSAKHWVQPNADLDGVRLNVQLDSINFYEDVAKTRLIYSYQP